jgi:hypothetical protein
MGRQNLNEIDDTYKVTKWLDAYNTYDSENLESLPHFNQS